MSVNYSDHEMECLENSVLEALRQIVSGKEGPDVVASGQIYDVVATGGAVRILLDPENIPEESQEALAEAITPLVEDLPGVESVVVKPRPKSVAKQKSLPGIKHVVGIHSGKGGVGKSTLTVNLAVALSEQGFSVGLLDADVYGPSVPTLLGVAGRAEITDEDGLIEPKTAYGVRMMSLGLLIPEDQALIWRGSLVDEGLPQFFHDIDWGELDLLLVDLPPGTSDVHLAVARSVELSGVITVTTPGQVSVDDVRRGLEMFADLAVPSLGLVENMAGVNCQKCGHTSALFGEGGGVELSDLTGLPLLASLPFMPAVAVGADEGHPVAVDALGTGACFHELARCISASLRLTDSEEVSI